MTLHFNISKGRAIILKWSEVAQSCLTLCNPMGCSLPGSSVHGIFQTRMLEWIAIFFARGSSRPRNRTQVSRIAGRCFTIWATREVTILRTMLILECLFFLILEEPGCVAPLGSLPLQDFLEMHHFQVGLFHAKNKTWVGHWSEAFTLNFQNISGKGKN